jgi:hypothetical protein
MPFVSLDSWSWVPALQFFLPAVPSKAAFVKVSTGGCWIPFFSCICLVAFFFGQGGDFVAKPIQIEV